MKHIPEQKAITEGLDDVRELHDMDAVAQDGFEGTRKDHETHTSKSPRFTEPEKESPMNGRSMAGTGSMVSLPPGAHKARMPWRTGAVQEGQNIVLSPRPTTTAGEDHELLMHEPESPKGVRATVVTPEQSLRGVSLMPEPDAAAEITAEELNDVIAARREVRLQC